MQTPRETKTHEDEKNHVVHFKKSKNNLKQNLINMSPKTQGRSRE